jgi:hypothetical protein
VIRRNVDVKLKERRCPPFSRASDPRSYLGAKRKVVDENDIGLINLVAPVVAEKVALYDLITAVELVEPLHALLIVILHELVGVA